VKAIQLVRIRELAARMRFWTAIVGYDPRDHSVSHRLYLGYIVIFFSLWGFSVLTLLAEGGTWVLSFFGGLPPGQAAVFILMVGLLLDADLRGYKACRRSPFVFSEEDAVLICQTPVDRRKVALAWLLGDWLPACLPFVVLAVVLRFSSLQLADQGAFLWSYLPRYWLAAFRITAIILPLHLAFMSSGYTLGSLRLRMDKDLPNLGWIPIGFALIMVSLYFTNKGFLGISLLPVNYPLAAGFSSDNWLVGFLLALILALTGLLVLYYASPKLNLSRAAQESSSRGAIRQAFIYGDGRVTERMRIRNRLGVQHSPTRLAGLAGAWSLVWKDAVISLRSIDFGKLLAWVGIFGLSMGMVVAPDWGTRFWSFIIWCLLIERRGTERLRSDLELWVISRQLPFSGQAAIVAELVVPALAAVLLTWLAVGFGALLGYSPQYAFTLVAPVAIITIVLAAVLDILQKCHASDLLTGQVAEPGAGGLILGGLLAGIPMGIVYWLTYLPGSTAADLMIALFGSALSLGVSYVLLKLNVSIYRGIK
jgi:uncharacterized membrane protein